jgi:spore germination protein KA
MGHALSIVGGLVVGQAAVTANIVSAPMLIVVGLTAVSSFVVSTLYEPVAVLRFTFIIVGGLTGIYGIMLCFAGVLVNISAINPYGVPFTSPLSPTRSGAFRDMIFRTDWKKMGKRRMETKKMENRK